MSDENRVQRKEWMTPQLTILLRNHPEEAVLKGCKKNTLMTTFAQDHNGCDKTRTTGQGNCGACQPQSGTS